MKRRILFGAAASLLVLLLVAQLVPYRTYNPLVTQAVVWDTPRTEELARRACYDCHSNEAQIPWYGYVAPVAWGIRHHVDEGREYLNFSEMDRTQPEAHEAAEELLEGEMPPAYYTAMHPHARLTAAETKELARGLAATLGGEAEGEHDEQGEHDD